MKNIFKLLGIAFVACSLMVACGPDEENNNTPTDTTPSNPDPQPQPQTPTFSVVLGTETVDIQEYDNVTNGQIWLWQGAKHFEGQRVQLPYMCLWLYGTSNDDMRVISQGQYTTELYYQTVYSDSQDNQYGDWQLEEPKSLTVSAIDLTALTMSANIVLDMYSLADYIDSTIAEEDIRHYDLAITYANMPFEASAGK